MKLIIKLFIITVFLLIKGSFLFAEDLEIKFSSDTPESSIEIKNYSGDVVSSITALGDAYCSDMYVKYDITSGSITVTQNFTIAEETIDNSIDKWNSTYDIVDATSSSWELAYSTLTVRQPLWDSSYYDLNSLYPGWDSAYDKLMNSRDNWDSTYRIVTSSINHWQFAYDVVKSTQSIWDTGYDIQTASQTYWYQAYDMLVSKDIYLRNDSDDQTTGKITAIDGFVTPYGINASTGLFSSVSAQSLDTFYLGQDTLITSNVEFYEVKTNTIAALGASGITLEDTNGSFLGVIDDNKFGIGETSPQAMLQIGHASDESSAMDGALILARSDGASNRGQFIIGLDTNYNLSIADYGDADSQPANTYDDTYMTVEYSDGNVGIGTTEPEDILEVYDGSSYYYSAPVGSILLFAGSTIPPGWEECDGGSLSQEDYQELYSVIGTRWGGFLTFFKKPDLTGRFLRGKDDTTSVGDTQTERFLSHFHDPGTLTAGDAGLHTHDIEIGQNNFSYDNDKFAGDYAGSSSFGMDTANHSETHWHSFSGETADSTLDDETRPDNAYIIYIIKVKANS